MTYRLFVIFIAVAVNTCATLPTKTTGSAAPMAPIWYKHLRILEVDPATTKDYQQARSWFLALADARQLKVFSSDGCSKFPDGVLWNRRLWFSCCLEHDKSYWLGGPEKSRRDADTQLEACVDGKGAAIVAKMMYAGVRIGGNGNLPTSFRWGYGWRYLRGEDHAITEDEAILGRALLTLFEKEVGSANFVLTQSQFQVELMDEEPINR